jgi:predicted ATPase/DNA-binding SARP family transcriptional activator/Tfp pilus assembly protein PilF
MDLTLQLLGGPRLSANGKSVNLRLKNPLLLMAHLAYREAWVPRGELMQLFWPEMDEARAQNNLRQLLYQVRQYPWAEALELEAGAARWCVATDVAAFRSALASGDWAGAVAQYQGELMAQVTDAPAGYSEWLAFERDNLGLSWRDAALKQAQALEAAGHLGEATELLERILQVDFLAEEVVESAMRMLACAGQRDVALKLFERFEQQLRDELGMLPLASTTQLAAAIREDTIVKGAAVPRAPSLRDVQQGAATLGRFIGRDLERVELAGMLSNPDCRLVTVIGPGGIGKSRLALQLAEEAAGAFAAGSRVIPLVALSAAEAMPVALARALGLTLSSQQDPMTQLVEALHEREMLLIFDNFEHLIAAGGGAVVLELLEAAPSCTVLVTSREALGLSGEVLYELKGLSCPEAETTPHLEAFDAVRLLLHHARRLSVSFTLDAQTKRQLVRLCHLLDGSPLALELAASWMRLLTIAEIADEIAQSPRLLERQGARGMAAVFEGSWAHLDAEERRVLAALAVFRDGFARAEAVAVTGASLHTLLTLVNKSLLERSATGRFRMHEVIRQYAEARLTEAANFRRRHAEVFAGLALELEAGLKGPTQRDWLKRFDAEHDNFRAALAWACQTGAVEVGLALASSLQYAWCLRGHYQEGRRWLDTLLARAATDEPPGKAKALHRAGVLAQELGELSVALRRYAAALALARREDDRLLIGEVLQSQGFLAREQGRLDEARALLHESLALQQASADRYGESISRNMLGIVCNDAGEWQKAQRYFTESLQLKRELGDQTGIAYALNNLGTIAYHLGDSAAERTYSEESLAIKRQLGDRSGVASSLQNLAALSLESGDFGSAHRYLTEALVIVAELGLKPRIAHCLTVFVSLAVAEAEFERALVLAGGIDGTLLPVVSEALEQAIGKATQQLGKGQAQRLLQRGAALPLDDIVALALSPGAAARSTPNAQP